MTITPETTPTLAQVRELPAGDKVTGFYLLTKIETRQKKDGAPYLVIHVQDASATLEALMWEGFEKFQQETEVGEVIKLEGTVDRFRDVPRLHISRVRKATTEEAPDKRMFLPHSVLSSEDARTQIGEQIEEIKDPRIKNLLTTIFEDEEFIDKFLGAPGGKLWHHATIGGLVEHTLSMVKLVRSVAANYPQINADLLAAGAFLHDVGKVFELSSDIAIDYSTDGRLLGHIVLGTMFVEKKIETMEEFPPELRKQLLHLILAHQGDGTMGSPVKPMTLEALMLHYCDEMDSRVNAFMQIKANTPEGQDFSEYVRLMDRFFYFKPIEEAAERDNT